jgi:hypothetical protein
VACETGLRALGQLGKTAQDPELDPNQSARVPAEAVILAHAGNACKYRDDALS